MSTFDWALTGLLVAFVLLVVMRRKPPTAQEIAKEVVIAQTEAAVQAKATATKDCGRCRREVPDWFSETLPGDEDVCFACSEGKPYPGPGETEDAYVASWMAGKEARKAADRALIPEPEAPQSVFDPPGDT